MLARLPGRLWPGWYGLMDDRLEMLARLPGRGGGAAMSPRVGVGGGWPNEGRLFLCLMDGVVSSVSLGSESTPLIVLPPARFRLLRTVTDEGM